MKLGRYHDSPNSLNFLQMSNKITPRSTYGSLPKNPETPIQYSSTMKLPSLNMRKSAMSFTTNDRNTKFKLQSLQQKLQDMSSEVHNARMDANQTLNHMHFLRQQLLDKQLCQSNQDMKQQISGLKKLVKITKHSHQSRSNELREDYIRLWNQTEDMRELVFSIRMRIDKIQDTMGMKNLE